ncbi:cytochrome P450 [Metabacillus litoralis]|uniref:Cytochrome P450 n=1 Tax=Metabacillus litoralis TaxID=152268 RepID=A0A5C6W0N3_9BACI|nr:cytochrome P450 [Metabacillus litoralis]TXC89325.1 cytochrome P450 [Metabacillus litoralis]
MSRVKDVTTSRMQNYLDFRNDPLAFFMKMQNGGEVVSLRTGLQPSFIVNSPDFVREILVAKDASFKKGRTDKVLRRTIHNGLLTAEKHDHKRQKSYYQPIFYKERLNSYAKTIVEETKSLVTSLQDVEYCKLNDEMMQLTLAIIARVMFATNVEENKKQLADAVSDTIEQTAQTLFTPIIVPLAIPTKGNKIHKKAINKLEDMIYCILHDAKQHPDQYKMTMVGMLLDTQNDTGSAIDDEEIRDQMMTMLLAGHETSANLLTWIFYALNQNPDVEQKLYEEIKMIDLEQSPFELYSKLNYTQLVIKEALRMYPPAWLIYRESEEAVELLGETFKAGSTFMICSYAIHRNEKVFPEPEKFKPERFADKKGEDVPKFAYLPFGGGSRSCIGSKFAIMETTLILAILVKEYKFKVEQETVTPDPLVSLRIKEGLKVKVEKR